jgi:hypothetical protein
VICARGRLALFTALTRLAPHAHNVLRLVHRAAA